MNTQAESLATNTAPHQRPVRVDALDGLRAIAVVAVVLMTRIHRCCQVGFWCRLVLRTLGLPHYLAHMAGTSATRRVRPARVLVSANAETVALGLGDTRCDCGRLVVGRLGLGSTALAPQGIACWIHSSRESVPD